MRTFTTGNPTSVPNLSAPANSALVATTTPFFDWSNSTLPAGTTFDHYQIQVSADAAFSAPLIDANTAIGDNTDSDYAAAINLARGAAYYWRVRAWNATGDFSGWSAVRTVRITFAAPALTAPADAALGVARMPTFTWTAIAGATNYTLQVSTSNTFSPLAVNKTVGGLTYTHNLNLLANTVYYWRMRANGPFGPGEWSATFSFTTTP